jgi:hypothetical protein
MNLEQLLTSQEGVSHMELEKNYTHNEKKVHYMHNIFYVFLSIRKLSTLLLRRVFTYTAICVTLSRMSLAGEGEEKRS